MHLSKNLPSLVISCLVASAAMTSLSLTAQTTPTISKRSFSQQEVARGVVFPSDTHIFFRCPANTITTLAQSTGVSAVRAWAYEYIGDEPPFDGKFWFTNAELTAHPDYAEFNTLREVTGNKKYYFMTQRPLYFRCEGGVSIPGSTSSSSSSRQSVAPSSSSIRSVVPSSSSMRSMPPSSSSITRSSSAVSVQSSSRTSIPASSSSSSSIRTSSSAVSSVQSSVPPSSSSLRSGVDGEIPVVPYKVGVNYHATTENYTASDTTGPFLKKYHYPEVRAEARRQLQALVDDGANIIKTAIWFVDDPAKPNALNWRLSFPPTNQEMANIKQYAEDVAAIKGKDGHLPEFKISFGFLGCADYKKVMADGTVGWCGMTWEQLIEKIKVSVGGVVSAVENAKRPDGKKVATMIYLEGELMTEIKVNQERFLKEVYPWFIERVTAAGITPSVYFLVANHPYEVFDEAFKDSKYPILNGHRSLYWVYRSTYFMEQNNLPVPDQLDFSMYLERTADHSFADIVRRVWSDLEAIYPGKKIGVVETLYPMEETDRRDLAVAFNKEAYGKGTLKEIIFWTTPDGASWEGGRPRVSVGFPLDVNAYQAHGIKAKDVNCPVAITAGALCSGTITWRAATTSQVQVLVSTDGGPKKLLACGTTGSKNISWLQPGHRYVFYLHTSSSCNTISPLSLLAAEPITVSSNGTTQQ